MSRFHSLTLTLALLLSLSATLDARQPPRATGSLTGVVFTEAGEPVADARVDLVDLHRRANVNGDAHFRFDDVPAGTYVVQALSRRYGTGVAQVEIRPGEATEVELRLSMASQVDEIVVTAGGDTKSRHELAQAVSVLGGEELSLRLQPTLGETLAQEPGVTSTYFGPGASRPVIRGLGGDRVRMLQGGLGAGDASATGADHAVGIDAGSAERIEVIRGPSTLLYGSSAIGGVVNVIDDKIPDYQVVDGLSGSVDLRAGTVSNERSGSASFAGGGERWAWHVSGSRRQTDDVDLPGEAGGTLDNSDLETASAAAGVSYFFADKGFLGVAVSGFDSQYGLPGAHHEEDEEPGGDEEVRIDLEQRRIDLKGELSQLSPAFEALRFRWGVSDYEHRELEGAEAGTVFTNDEWEGRIEMVQKQKGSWSGSFGLQAADRDFEAIGEEAFVPPSATRSLALFTFQEWDLDRISFQAGGRFERTSLDPDGGLPERDFDGVSASAGLVWKASDAYSVAFSLARSVKLPNAEELFSDGPHVASRTFELGDPDLGKETSFGLDLTLRRQGERIAGEVNVFVNRFADFIYQRFTGEVEDDLPVVAYAQDDARFAGFELESRFEIWESDASHLDLQLFGDYVEAELRETGEPLPRIPPLGYGAGLHYHSGRLHGTVEVRRRDGQHRLAQRETPTAGYTFVNASLSYRFFRGERIYDLLLRGTNLTDEVGRNHVSFLKDEVPLPGRDVSLALRLWF